MTLTMDAEHVYRLDGAIVPSVTQTLVEVGIIDTTFYTEEARVRGQYIAEATALDDRGELDATTLDPVLRPYIEAWRWFRANTRHEILAIEERVSNGTLGYAGTLDRRVRMNGSLAIFDMKSGGRERWHGLQLAAYAGCFTVPHKRFGVYLSDDGRPQLHEYTDRSDWDVFRAALAVTNWKRRNR